MGDIRIRVGVSLDSNIKSVYRPMVEAAQQASVQVMRALNTGHKLSVEQTRKTLAPMPEILSGPYRAAGKRIDQELQQTTRATEREAQKQERIRQRAAKNDQRLMDTMIREAQRGEEAKTRIVEREAAKRTRAEERERKVFANDYIYLRDLSLTAMVGACSIIHRGRGDASACCERERRRCGRPSRRRSRGSRARATSSLDSE